MRSLILVWGPERTGKAAGEESRAPTQDWPGVCPAEMGRWLPFSSKPELHVIRLITPESSQFKIKGILIKGRLNVRLRWEETESW